ncbi:mitochondrial ribosomal death-associated protein 3-domain-containing protein [Thelephora terrestris]|uniref:Small ribosomal subunit protein mS29 n=1 Tax=Thelephora terrestris TaxID=56493 RepID=A0A9P6L756_9AGAM|nr:mitochondrial ribosomal death-associated protein 3-domain-containing protein [Thelephora terrestris]
MTRDTAPHTSSLNSDPLSTTNPPEHWVKREDALPPKMSSIHAARCLLGSTVKSTRAVAVGRTYATKQVVAGRSLAQKTKSSSFRPSRRNDAGGEGSAKKERSTGAFQTMSPTSLTAEIFKDRGADELVLPTFRPEALTQDKVATAMKFPVADTNPMRAFGLPKNIATEFQLLSKPFSVIRDVTLKVLGRLDSANNKSSFHSRMVLTGSQGCGKSYTLLQAVQYAAASNWLVFYFPYVIDTVNSSTSYTYDPRTKTYLQPAYAAQTLQNFLTANSRLLQELKTPGDVPIDGRAPIQGGTPLTELITIGAKDPSSAPAILSALMGILSKQTDYPVLLAIDAFQALYCKTSYKDPQFSTIKSYHLSMPRLLLEYASGKKSFARGAVIGALSASNTTFSAPIELRESLKLGNGTANSYIKRSPVLVSYAEGLTKITVPEALSEREAASLFDVWMKDKAISRDSGDELFMSKYSEAGGNPRDFVWKGFLATITL